MAKGITVTSSIITISGNTGETVAGTMAEEQIPLSLDILNREVLLVYAVDLNSANPQSVPGVTTTVQSSLSSTTRATVGTIANTNVLAAGRKQISSSAPGDSIGFEDVSPETPASNSLDYIGIVSTNDFFVQVQGTNQPLTCSVDWRMWCARAKVTADIYAALVQGETLSA